MTHGGSDSGPPMLHDFSTNANPLPAPASLSAALQAADRCRYPDPHYLALREQLGRAHGVPPERILPASGGAEAIRRLSLAALLQGLREAWVPSPGFGDYAAAAQALGLRVRPYADVTQLLQELGSEAMVWICEPCNPTGESLASAQIAAVAARAALTVLDRAYEPLRLAGMAPALPSHCWALHCPNKALGHTGVRAAYLIAPDEGALTQSMGQLAASWVLSAEGQVLLMQLHRPEIQAWLAESRAQLRRWSVQQREMLARLSWQQRESCTPFWLARPAAPLDHEALRAHGIKLRDASSFGLPGWVRVATLPPQSQLALKKVITQ
ncbi:aminotransferase class I/II-fold pyridoxal phosphate-dependent enzyme [Paucibacter sp. O1-1]|nr:aminotransferase class I/II-fold pyridoxal phosphate-dependent enzyme [Paucibacter sp. O1-1]MDA3827183.1 aminotransferase class I/II-fold pyridoxal phosphate-dependent enzyme [Paucibacter sp. O1-1]